MRNSVTAFATKRQESYDRCVGKDFPANVCVSHFHPPCRFSFYSSLSHNAKHTLGIYKNPASRVVILVYVRHARQWAYTRITYFNISLSITLLMESIGSRAWNDAWKKSKECIYKRV